MCRDHGPAWVCVGRDECDFRTIKMNGHCCTYPCGPLSGALEVDRRGLLMALKHFIDSTHYNRGRLREENLENKSSGSFGSDGIRI